MRLQTNRLHLVFLAVTLVSPAAAGERIYRSPVEQANLIELFTSEGCSSCPPADRWLSGLKDHPDLWEELVPVAFHVDYWDYIGWSDRFARPEYSQRQRRYAREGGVDVVYTPGVMSNGKEWRNFSWRPPETGGGRDVGVLEARVHGNAVDASFTPVGETPDEKLVLNIALLGAGLSTNVEAGENRGRELRHDFAVLEFGRARFDREGQAYAVSASLPKSDVDAERFALALWVSARGTQAPIQATGGWLGD